MDEFEQKILDFENAIKEQIDAIEVAWALRGFPGRLNMRKFFRRHTHYWAIGNKAVFDGLYNESQFEIILNEKTFKLFVIVNFQKLGYTRMEAKFPELVEAREKRGLNLPIHGSSTAYFACNTLEDVLELFVILEGSSLCF